MLVCVAGLLKLGVRSVYFEISSADPTRLPQRQTELTAKKKKTRKKPTDIEIIGKRIKIKLQICYRKFPL